MQPTICEDCPFLRHVDGGLECTMQDISGDDKDIIPWGDSQTIAFKEKLCQFKRTPNWAVKVLKKKVREEVKLNYGVLITEKNISASKAQQFLKRFADCALPPKKVTFYVDKGDNDLFIQFLNRVCHKYPWHVRTINYDFYPVEEDYLKNLKDTHYTLIIPGDIYFDFDYVHKLDKRIHDEGYRFRGILHGEKGTFLNNGVYKNMGVVYSTMLERLEDEGFVTDFEG